MKYRFEATDIFWASFYSLSNSQKASARQAWAIFKENPFDPRLRTHKIHRVSAKLGQTVYACVIEGDLRVLFWINGDRVVTLEIGSHDIYEV